MKVKPNRFRQYMLCGEHIGKSVAHISKVRKNKNIEICLQCNKEDCKGSCDLMGGK